ncbi:MAG: M16 family metallopeptidase, partial [Thermodesulfobacteriota bacterium]
MSAEPSDISGVSRFVLDNGLTVILEENSSSPVTAVNVWVKTGSACEIEGEYGLAHVHEHMLFKGTKKRAVGEIAKTVEAGGGDINAFTSFDETVYFVISASRFLESTLDILADAMQNSTFDPVELEKELEVVQEEIRRGDDSPGRVLSQKMFSTAYDKHTYGLPIIGTQESVDSFTREKILNFYNKWYTPQNMVLVIVGDFNSKNIIPTIEKTFGKLEKRELPECKIPAEPKQNKIKTFVIDKDINEAYFTLAFHVSNASHEDTPVVDVISNIMGAGDSSRLNRRIKEELGLVTSIYSYSFTPKYDGVFVVGGTLQADKVDEAFKEIIKEVYKIKYLPVSNDELKKAQVNLESSSIYSKETMQGQAQKLGVFEVEAGDYKYEQEYLDRVSRVTPEDVKRIANKYFVDSNITAGALLPTDKKTITAKQLKNTIIDEAKLVKSKYSKKQAPGTDKVTRKELKNGIRVLVKEIHSVPIFSARAVFLGGVRYEDETTNGLSNFLSNMFIRGTASRSSEEIAVEIDSMAGELEGFSGRNSFGVTVDALSKNFNQAMELFSDVVLNPSFPDEEIERARREIVSDIKKQDDNLLRKSINLFLNSLYTEHPYRFNVLGNKENVERFNSKDLNSFYRKLVDPRNLVITVVGDVNTEEVLEEVEKYFGSMEESDFIQLTLQNEKKQNDIREEVLYEKDKAQIHIILGFQGPTIYDKDYYAFEVLNSILAGQGGRLFLELRDKKSLAYTVTSFLSPG